MWLVLFLLSCGGETPPPPKPGDSPSAVASGVTAVVSLQEQQNTLRPPSGSHYAASHILISWQGAVRAGPKVTRSEEEARTLAARVRERALAGDLFAELAKLHSNGPSKHRGGRLGVYRTGTMMPSFEAAVGGIQVGEIGPVVRTPFGFHIVRRDAIVEVRISHIMVPFVGAWRSQTKTTEDQARESIARARQRVSDGEDFAAVAADLSQDSTARVGGDLGRIAHGQMMPTFEQAAFALQVGELSDLVETPYGFHLLQRTE